MKVIILAGGLGTRLRTVVSDVPKPLAPVQDRAYLGWMLKALYDKGIREVILSVGYMAETFEQFIEQQHQELPSLEVHLLVEPQQLGTGGALRLCYSHYPDEQYLVMNGDSFCDFDFQQFSQLTETNQAAIVVAKVDDIRRYGEVIINADETVVEFREKSDLLKAGWINAGIYLIPGTAVEKMPEHVNFSLEQEIIPGLVQIGLACYRSTAPFIDIGIPEDYQKICDNPEQYFSP